MDQREADGTFVPQLISLPKLPGVSSPKGFNSSTSFQFFLLSKQRFEIVEEVDDFLHSREFESAGLVPTGPHGVGKSAIGLLLASYAFLNRHVLIYIVSVISSFFLSYFSLCVANGSIQVNL